MQILADLKKMREENKNQPPATLPMAKAAVKTDTPSLVGANTVNKSLPDVQELITATPPATYAATSVKSLAVPAAQPLPAIPVTAVDPILAAGPRISSTISISTLVPVPTTPSVDLWEASVTPSPSAPLWDDAVPALMLIVTTLDAALVIPSVVASQPPAMCTAVPASQVALALFSPTAIEAIGRTSSKGCPPCLPEGVPPSATFEMPHPVIMAAASRPSSITDPPGLSIVQLKFIVMLLQHAQTYPCKDHDGAAKWESSMALYKPTVQPVLLSTLFSASPGAASIAQVTATTSQTSEC